MKLRSIFNYLQTKGPYIKRYIPYARESMNICTLLSRQSGAIIADMLDPTHTVNGHIIAGDTVGTGLSGG